MARLWVFGVEEVAINADFTKTNCNHADAGVTVVTDVVHGGLKAAQFPTSATNFIARSFSTYTSGKLYTRFYVYFRDFGTTGANSWYPIFRHTNAPGSGRALVEFNPSTKQFGINNRTTGTDSRTAGTAVISSGKWYRIETETIVSTTTTGSFTAKVFDGDNTTPLDTIAQTGTATTADNILGAEFGNRNGADIGTLVMDDFGWNDDSGTFQNSWLGPGKIEMITGSATASQQWIGATGLAPNSRTTPNMFGFDDLQWNTASPAATTNNNSADQNVDDTATGSINDADYQKSNGSSSEFDRLHLTPVHSSDASDGNFVLTALYVRYGGSGTGTFKLRLWDGATAIDSGAIPIPTSGYARLDLARQLTYALTGKSVSQVNALDAGYFADSGTGEKRISALWMNVEFIPSGLVTVTSSAVHRYATLSAVNSSKTPWFAFVQGINAAVLTPYEAKSALTAVSQSATTVYELLTSVTQSY